MVRIFEVNLRERNIFNLRFTALGGELGSALNVTDEGGNNWFFNCRSEGGKVFCISGPGWEAFARERIGYRVTLIQDDNGNYTVVTRRR